MKYDDMLFGVIVALLIMYIVYNLSKYVYNWYSRVYFVENYTNINQYSAPPHELRDIINKNIKILNHIHNTSNLLNVNLDDIIEFQILSWQLATDNKKYSKEDLEELYYQMKVCKRNAEIHWTKYTKIKSDSYTLYSTLSSGTRYIPFNYKIHELHYELNKFLTHLINRENSTELYSGPVQVRDNIRKQYWEYMNK